VRSLRGVGRPGAASAGERLSNDPLLSRLTLEDGPRGSVVLNVGNAWLEPCHLVGLLARAEFVKSTGVALTVRAPSDRNKAAYAARMRLGTELDRLGVKNNIPTTQAARAAEDLLELKRVSTAADGRKLADVVTRRLVGEGLSDVRSALYEGITELCENVEQHAQSVGFIAAQTYAGRAHFAVADGGKGLVQRLSIRGATDPESALNLALDGVSTFSGPGHGCGLSSTAAVVSEMGGHLHVATGDRAMVAAADGRRLRTLPFAYTGTLLQVVIPLPKAT
jgi:hypothetical protein